MDPNNPVRLRIIFTKDQNNENGVIRSRHDESLPDI